MQYDFCTVKFERKSKKMSKDLKEIIEDDWFFKEKFRENCQGGDPFYYGPLPGIDKRPVNLELIHGELNDLNGCKVERYTPYGIIVNEYENAEHFGRVLRSKVFVPYSNIKLIREYD